MVTFVETAPEQVTEIVAETVADVLQIKQMQASNHTVKKTSADDGTRGCVVHYQNCQIKLEK